MLKTIQSLTSFNAGELSPLLEGRPDLAKYANGLRHTENFKFAVQGAAIKRTGTEFVSEVKNSNDRVWLVPFVASASQAYVLEFGHLYIRFYTNRGQLLSGGSPYEVITPYTSSMLTNADGTFGLSVKQINDIMFIACGSRTMPIGKLKRLAPTNWTFSYVETKNGPFKTINTTDAYVTPTDVTGNITITASSSIFEASHVGSLFYIGESKNNPPHRWEIDKTIVVGDKIQNDGKNYVCIVGGKTGTRQPTHFEGTERDGDPGVSWEYINSRYGIVKIIGYTSPTQVNATVISRLPDNTILSGGTTRWAHAAWSNKEGWPSKLCLDKERLVAAGGLGIWISVAGDYAGDFMNFAARNESGQVTQDMAISLTLPSDRSTEINWLSSHHSAILIGTSDGEYSIEALSNNQPFGPENVAIKMIGSYGSKNVHPESADRSLLFVSRCGISLRDFSYMPGSFPESADQNMFSDRICQSGMLQIAYQKEPDRVIWCAMKDGRLVGLTYSKEQYDSPPYGGWHAHYIGGDGFVESVASISAPNIESDELWMVVRRTINGSTRRYIEYMSPRRKYSEDIIDAFYVDSGLTYIYRPQYSISLPTQATQQYSTNVQIVASGPSFASTDIGREIHFSYYKLSEYDRSTKLYYIAKAEITSYVDSTHVLCTINYPFPYAGTIASTEWRMTVTQISGLDHLEGSYVSVLADGQNIFANGTTKEKLRVVDGKITLPSLPDRPAKFAKIHIGFEYIARLQTMRAHVAMSDGSSMGQTAKVTQVIVRLNDTIGLYAGHSFDKMEELVSFRNVYHNMDRAVEPFTGDIKINWKGDFNSEPWLCFQSSDPLPCTIVSIAMTLGISAGG